MERSGGTMLCAIAVAVLAAGCTFERVQSYTPRTATEQLLLSTAFERAVEDIDLPEVTGKAVVTELAMLGPGEEFADDAAFVQAVLEAAVARTGGRVVKKAADADIVVTAIIGALGTNGRSALVGFPGASAAVISLPEIPIFKVLREDAYARLSLVTRDRDGRLLSRSNTVTGHADFNVYTIFFIAFRSSDIYEESLVGVD